MDAWKLLTQIRIAYQTILGPKLTGIYVHGSLAFGCFRWECSDIDFLVVAESPLLQAEKEALIHVLLDLDPLAPAKGFEMSVVTRSVCSPFQDPTPYELHYSNTHRAGYQRDLSGTCKALQGFDPDLAAHMTVTRTVGVTLCGPTAETVFAPVPKESYLRSLWYDIQNAPDEIGQNLVYCVLNLCRVLAFLSDGLILSKETGATWCLSHLPQEAPIIQKALSAYRLGVPLTGGSELRSFAVRMLERLRRAPAFLSVCLKKY